MLKEKGRRDRRALPEKYLAYHDAVARVIPATRIFCDPFHALAYGTDASFYRLIPKIVVKVRAPEEVALILGTADRLSVPVPGRLLQQPYVRDRPHSRERTAVPVHRLPRGPVFVSEGTAGLTMDCRDAGRGEETG